MPSASCFFLLVFAFSENHYQKVSKREEKNFGLIFSGPEEIHEALGEDQKSHEEATSQEGAPRGVGRAPQAYGPLVTPPGLIPAL